MDHDQSRKALSTRKIFELKFRRIGDALNASFFGYHEMNFQLLFIFENFILAANPYWSVERIELAHGLSPS